MDNNLIYDEFKKIEKQYIFNISILNTSILNTSILNTSILNTYGPKKWAKRV